MKLKFNSALPLLALFFSTLVSAGDVNDTNSVKLNQLAELTLAGDQSAAGSRTQMGSNVKRSPSFVEMDINKDNYVTKDELKDYPILTQDFEKADAGKDGRLEQLEYLNLLMEKRRDKYLEKH